MALKVVFAGTPEFAATALSALIDAEFNVVAVYTQPDRPQGRGQVLTASPVKQLALQHHISVYQPLNFKAGTAEGEQAINHLQTLNADIMVVAAYGIILPQVVLNTPRLGCINIHASLLPRWRGAAPIHRAILAGDTQTGITIMQMDKGLDTGDMLHKVTTDILPEDNSQTLHDRLADMGGEAVVYALNHLAELSQNKQKQNNGLVNYAHKLTKLEGQINWQQSAAQINNQIRAFIPWPVSYTQHNGQTIRILAAHVEHTQTNQPAGTIVKTDKTGIYVATHDAVVVLTSMQWAGGKALNAHQVHSSQKITVGAQLI